ncbi:hypothetical protein WMW72_07320 [Paenibacillus filicis]|uniref:ABC transporter permease n=1 Tax=Paenibacillus filicis TaxID=669464 RepID=A0ABU9DI20_9BACL
MIQTSCIFYYLVKNHLIKQMRSYSFLMVAALSIFLGYVCVPAASDGYEVFYIGGVRGIYNSAWLGGMAAMLSTLLLWLFGFYMLRSQISEDGRLKVGQIIASTPTSNFRYIFSKVLSNFVVLAVMEGILLLAFIGMQLLRGEDYKLQLGGYLLPLLFIALPSLLVLAALTVLFDVLPGMKGVVGNIAFFTLWMLFSVISIAAPNSFWDVFGLDIIRADMVQEAVEHYPFLESSQEGGSFGYYPVEGSIPTFEWQGVEWAPELLVMRLAWVGIALLIVILSSLLFTRFSTPNNSQASGNLIAVEGFKKPQAKSGGITDYQLSPVVKDTRIRITRLIRAELLIMLKGYSIWWYLLVTGVIAGSLLIPLDKVQSWLPITLILPIAIWSQMGTREKHFFTRDLLLSSCPPLYKFMAVLIAGILITLLISSGALIHYAWDGRWTSFAAWVIGALFVPTIALALGYISSSRRLFEVIYLLWWYLGPVNDIPYLDFLGLSRSYIGLYSILTLLALGVAMIAQQARDGGSLRIRTAPAKDFKNQYTEGESK